MAKHGNGAHYELHFLYVFVTGYRRPVSRCCNTGTARELIQENSGSEDAVIVKGNASIDLVQLLLNIPPGVLPRRIMQSAKEKSSHHLVREFLTPHREYWGWHFWARKYVACTTGGVTDAVIPQEIELQGAPPQDNR